MKLTELPFFFLRAPLAAGVVATAAEPLSEMCLAETAVAVAVAVVVVPGVRPLPAGEIVVDS